MTNEGTPITNTAELVIWGTINVIILLTTIPGDTLVLIGTIKYNAIRQHKVIVAIIQHLAVLDIGAAVFLVLPTIQVMITGSWEFGMFLCHVNAQIYLVLVMMTPTFICFMSAIKLYIVKNPLKTATWTLKLGHKICGGLWILILFLHTPRSLFSIIYAGNTIHFDFITYNCYYNVEDVASKTEVTWYTVIATSLGVSLNVVLIGTSITLLVVARKAADRLRDSLRWEGVTTVLVTVAVYLLSTIPPLAEAIAVLAKYKINMSASHAAYQLMRVAVMTNFFIYCLTVSSFREFLKSRILPLLLEVGRLSRISVSRESLAPLLEDEIVEKTEDGLKGGEVTAEDEARRGNPTTTED